MIVADGDLLVHLDGAALHPANGNTTHVLVVVNGGNQHLQGGIGVTLRGVDILDDGLKQGLEIRAHFIGAVGSGALAAGAEDGGAVELLVRCIQVQQQLQHFVHYLVHPGIGLIHLVHRHDHLMTQLQCLLQHKTGLRHGAFSGIYQKDDAVDHFQDTLHLAAEVSVARGIHDIDFIVLVMDRGILCQNGDAALPLQIAGVHHPLHGGLIFPVNTALLQHFIHQRGLAMVNMGNNRNISNFLVFHKNLSF